MALNVTLNWTNQSQNLTKQAIYFGDETTQTLLDDNIAANATTYTHTLPPEYTEGNVYYRISSIVVTAEGVVEETSNVLSVDLDINKGFVYTTNSPNFAVMTFTPFYLYLSDGQVITSTNMEVGPGVFASVVQINDGATGRTRIVPQVGEVFELLNILTEILTIESWGGYEYIIPEGFPEEGRPESPLMLYRTALTGVPADAPNCTSLANLFNGAVGLEDPNLITWDVSHVTDMTGMFQGATSFNQDIGNWNVSAVTKMDNMFAYAYGFNQDLSQWCVPYINSDVIDGSMFADISIQPEYKPVANTCPRGEVEFLTINLAEQYVAVGEQISLLYYTNIDDTDEPVWSVDNEALATIVMTDHAEILGIATGTVTVTLTLGSKTATATYEVRQRNTPMILTKRAGENFCKIEFSMHSARDDLALMIDWGDNATPTELLFGGDNGLYYEEIHYYGDDSERTITIYSDWQPLPNVDIRNNVSAVTQWCSGGWDILRLGPHIVSVPTSIPETVVSLEGLFNRSSTFNQDISMWDVSNVIDMSHMFSNCTEFDQDISGWDVSNVTSMYYMFTYASTFNQPIGSWNVGNVTTMQGMMFNAEAFDQDLSQWCVLNTASDGFAVGSALQYEHLPVWGTCPRGEVT